MKDSLYSVRIILLILVSLSTLITSCEKSPTEPVITPSSTENLLLSRISVAVVPGGQETVIISATDNNNSRETCTVICDKSDIAQVTLTDSVLHITGVKFGAALVTVTSKSGVQRDLPVEVYNHKVLDTGELLITYVDTFYYRWHDGGSGQPIDGAYYHPITTDGFRAIGSLGQSGYNNPDGKKSIMAVKAKDGSDALAEPTDYTLVWNDKGSGSDNDGSFWIPVPPAGYVAMGIVAQRGYNKPALNDVVCVRADLTTIGEVGAFIWRYQILGIITQFSSWTIDPPDAGPHEQAYLATGTFVAVNSGTEPSIHPAMNVLKLPLPLLGEAPYQTYVPELTGYDTPSSETVPMFACAMLMPCTILKDPLYSNNPHWRIRNSPFYRLEREVYYKLQSLCLRKKICNLRSTHLRVSQRHCGSSIIGLF